MRRRRRNSKRLKERYEWASDCKIVIIDYRYLIDSFWICIWIRIFYYFLKLLLRYVKILFITKVFSTTFFLFYTLSIYQWYFENLSNISNYNFNLKKKNRNFNFISMNRISIFIYSDNSNERWEDEIASTVDEEEELWVWGNCVRDSRFVIF